MTRPVRTSALAPALAPALAAALLAVPLLAAGPVASAGTVASAGPVARPGQAAGPSGTAPSGTAPSGAAPSGAAVRRALAVTAAPPAPAGGAVTLVLRAAEPARLHDLAALPPPTPAQRTSRLAAVARALPGAAEHAAVLAAVRRLGFQASSTGPWTVALAGSPARVLADFGSAAAVRPGDPVAQGLPRLPASLRGQVLVALGGDEHRPLVRAQYAQAAPRALPAGGYTGADLAGAYDTTVGAPAPGYGGQTVATLQFSGWNSQDLYSYAQQAFGAATPNPLTDGQYTAVPVDGASPATPQNGDDVEVALDQEALLGVAPYARQRAYFAPNSNQGFIDVLSQVASDAANPALHIVALSDSYGACEPAWDSGTVAAMEGLFQQLLAEGVTVFGPTGDTGSADCQGSPAASVDYPGSSPWVVAVGGTTLTLGSPPSETAWSGSGGGSSVLFSRPSWQAHVGLPGSMRLVPDIATDADDRTGYDIYDSLQGGWLVAGGTSLAAPTSAALLADELIDAGVTHGVGDIHPVLYGAPAGSVRDITSGSNGAFTAGPGYDEVTGLGAPLWDQLRASLVSETTTYHPVAPTRVLDTRTGTGASGAVGPGQSITVHLAGASGSPVPAGAAGVVLNVTATGATAPTYVSVFATGDPTGPRSSDLNLGAGQTVPNLVTTRLSPAGDVTLYNNAGSTQLVADLEGYYTADTSGATYHPSTPTRVLDTRTGTGTAGVAAPLGPRASLDLALAGQPGTGVPSGASAVALTVTATDPTATTYVTVYPGGQRPTASNLNLGPGQTAANLVVAPLSSSGGVTLYNNAGSTELVADLAGYYTADASGATFHPLDPHRILDTRSGLGAPAAPVGPRGMLSFRVAGLQGSGVPATATAVVVNLTGTDPSALTYLSLFPAGDTSGQTTSVLNLVAAQTAADLTVTGVGNGGQLTVYNNRGSTQVVADVVGYYTSP